MAQVATQGMTFLEFLRLPEEDARYELVDGKLSPLMPPDIYHGIAQVRLSRFLDEYLSENSGAILGTEIDFPTLPFHGRRGDIVYVAAEHVTQEDWDRGYPTHPPDLVIEVVSPGDADRDYRDKMQEYARVGIAHYWIADRSAGTIETYVLEGDAFTLARRFGADDTLASTLFPGLEIPVSRVFRP